MRNFLITLFRKNKYLLLVFYIFLDIWNFISSKIITRNYRTGDRKNSQEIINYVDFCLKEIKKSNIDFKFVRNALEIGPGDNFSLALCMVYEGVNEVYLLDKFQKVYDQKSNLNLYKQIGNNQGKTFIEDDLKKLKNVSSKKGLDIFIKQNKMKFDLIYSVSVLEHIWPLDEYLEYLRLLMTSKGKMVHIVNFTDHKMYSPDHDIHFFRRIPEFLYNPTMKLMGRPNRVLPSQYLNKLSKLGFKTDMKIIRKYDKKDIENSKLNKKNKNLKLNHDHEIASAIFISHIE